MRKVVILAFIAIGVLGVGAAATAQDDDGSSQNGARLNGYQEVTSISTTGFGSFHIKFNKDDTADYVLSYRGIETPVTQAHIHFAQRSQNGPIQVWLCDGDPAAAPVPPARPPGSPPFPTCPAFGPDGGTVSGTASGNSVDLTIRLGEEPCVLGLHATVDGRTMSGYLSDTFRCPGPPGWQNGNVTLTRR